MNASAFKATYGFNRDEVRLGNWREAPWNVWAFRHVSEFIPTARIAATPGLTEEPVASADDLLRQQFTRGGTALSVADALRTTSTDAMVVMKRGRVVADFHAPQFDLQSRHILFSASKSVTSVVAGILHEDGLLDFDELVPRYVPELKGSAYGDARVRDVLDMRVSLDFEEVYHDPDGLYARYRRAGLLEPSRPGETENETVVEFIAKLKKGKGAHGGPYHYASPNSDVLGLVIQGASGRRFSDLASQRLFQPVGARQDAYVTVDRAGTPRTGGGINMTPRDLARIGEMLRQGGTANGRRIVSQAWVEDTVTGGSAQAWAGGESTSWLPQGRYRNKWYQTGAGNGAFFALGIHGQWLYVDPRAEMVIAKFSSQPDAIVDDAKTLNLALFEAIARMV
ncbi:serine hydrolase [Variovorax sp. J22G73]|uniref:serine hydrolase domain-containing protein n=1 Tax=unclassified Variovorax TaxID=663243 RepID=UPI002576FC7C|nr:MULTISPECIES: serine hydrolase [unclassified Variovorax]MDM0004721.1 serine hydrolase [Variovorax sp. J22R203]MDM0098137.1 serine hydrolase [Variovorax sp. J22G73]